MKISLTILVIFLFYPVFAQKRTVNIYEKSDTNIHLTSSTKLDTLQINRKIKQYLEDYNQEGYIAVGVDSVVESNEQVDIYYTLGHVFYWGNLEISGLNEHEKKKFEKGVKGKRFTISEFNLFRENILDYLENEGFPFASIQFKEVNFNTGKLDAKVFIERGSRFVIDTIFIQGTAKISPSYMFKLIDISPGDIYREDQIISIGKKISSTSFLSEKRSPAIEFYKDRASLYLYLAPRKASQFDGIIGFLPNDQDEGKIQFTGN
ncbi:MAG: hypothetical protein ACOCWG_01875, partial [bacterium]